MLSASLLSPQLNSLNPKCQIQAEPKYRAVQVPGILCPKFPRKVSSLRLVFLLLSELRSVLPSIVLISVYRARQRVNNKLVLLFRWLFLVDFDVVDRTGFRLSCFIIALMQQPAVVIQ